MIPKPLTEIPPDIQRAFSLFCKERDWSEAEVLTHLMLRAIDIGDDLVIQVIKQRNQRKQDQKWYERFAFLDSYLDR
jgi:hypothetical protein